MSDFDDIRKEIERGVIGKTSGLKMGFNRLNKYIGIRKRIYTLIIGSTGSGKSAFLHNAYFLNPFEFSVSKQNTQGVKFKGILFSMERSKLYTITKWISRRIFLDQGVMIPVSKMLGWWDEKLTPEEFAYFAMYEEYIDTLLKSVDIIEGPQNPTGIYKYVKKYAESVGKVEEESEFKKIYIPNDEDIITIIGVDHLGLMKTEKGMTSKKEAIDKTSEYLQIFRDFYGFSPVPVSQLNRNLGNPIYQKFDNVEPSLDDAKESGNPAEAADVVLSLFDPLRFKTNDISYDANKFLNENTGAKTFRSVKILKSSFSEDSIRIGMAFEGATGIFKELPKPSNMEGFDYESVLDGSYFLENR